ncbi:MAG: type II toxin-antitoxin system VapC family toxin [candidate division KSB1 bacterium]
MKPTVYIETSVLSYLTAQPSRDLVVAAHQQTTSDWWHRKRHDFDLYASQLVVLEAGRGDPEAAEKRLNVLKTLALLETSTAAEKLAKKLLDQRIFPPKAADDALHVGIATVNGMNYLLTWNFKHIAKAETRDAVERISRESGYEPPIICTPEELLGE